MRAGTIIDTSHTAATHCHVARWKADASKGYFLPR